MKPDHRSAGQSDRPAATRLRRTRSEAYIRYTRHDSSPRLPSGVGDAICNLLRGCLVTTGSKFLRLSSVVATQATYSSSLIGLHRTARGEKWTTGTFNGERATNRWDSRGKFQPADVGRDRGKDIYLPGRLIARRGKLIKERAKQDSFPVSSAI